MSDDILGPWFVLEENDRFSISTVETREEAVEIEENCGDSSVGGVWFDAGNKEECRRIAHLMAAAPDLLAALRDLLAATETAEDTHEDWQGYVRAKDAARAAISRATPAKGEPKS